MQSIKILRFSSLAVTVDLRIHLRPSMQNVPFLIFCILLNQYNLEVTTALRQLWTYILRVKCHNVITWSYKTLVFKIITPTTVIFQNISSP